MRDKLEAIDTVRGYFEGKFERIGGKGGKQFTVLLTDIKYANKKTILCDHAWLNMGKQMQQLGWLDAGTIIYFHARISKYRKGSIKRGIPVEYDYRFSYPSRISREN